jgi:hypothetical protein
MEICISLADATSAASLREGLVGVFGVSGVSLDARSAEVRVHAQPGVHASNDRSVIRTIGAVQAWLVDHSLSSAMLRLGTHSCVLHGAARMPGAAPPTELQRQEHRS